MTTAVQQLAVHKTEALLFFTLLQLIIIIGVARVAALLAGRIGQAQAVGEIVAGILLGPSLLGLLAPETFAYIFKSVSPDPINIMSQIGLVLLMFQIGLEFEFSHLKETRNRRTMVWVATAGMVLPFLLGLAFGYVSAPYLAPGIQPLGYALFMATAFSITAVPILGRIMMEFNITRTKLGAITITCAAINDVIGWFLLAAVTALAAANFSAGETAQKLAWFVFYLVISWWVVRPLLIKALNRFKIDRDHLPYGALGLLIVIIFVSAMATYKIGIFAIFGGFMMGVILFDQVKLVEAWRAKIADFVTVFFLPIFFTYTGLRTNVQALGSLELWAWFAVILALATLGKFGGSYWAARHCGLNPVESKIIGVMMNTRALMELIVLNIGYDLGVIPSNVFTMLVLMAIISTVITSPALRAWLPQLKPAKPPADAAAVYLK